MEEEAQTEPPKSQTEESSPERKPPKLVFDKVIYTCGCVAIGLKDRVPHACIGHGTPGADMVEETTEIEDPGEATAQHAQFYHPPIPAAETGSPNESAPPRHRGFFTRK